MEMVIINNLRLAPDRADMIALLISRQKIMQPHI